MSEIICMTHHRLLVVHRGFVTSSWVVWSFRCPVVVCGSATTSALASRQSSCHMSTCQMVSGIQPTYNALVNGLSCDWMAVKGDTTMRHSESVAAILKFASVNGTCSLVVMFVSHLPTHLPFLTMISTMASVQCADVSLILLKD
jgi:hypothetical protein